MKILFDPVYTQRPHTCSTSFLVWELIGSLIKWRPDVFFYVLYPPNNFDDDSKKFMSRYPDRVRILPLEQCTNDRMTELFMLRPKLRSYLVPWSRETWDVDVVISSRLPVLKHMRVQSTRHMGKRMLGVRAFIGLEEMPLLPYREALPWSDHVFPDTLMSYALADGIIVGHQWLKSMIKPLLKEVLTPAWQKQVLDNVHEALPTRLSRLNLKTSLYEKGPFKLTFVGRVTGTRNFNGVAELFRKQFSYPLGKNKQEMEFLVSTNSQGFGVSEIGEVDFIDIQQNNREEFFEFLKHAHLAVSLSPVEDFSMSVYETLLHGVPLIVQNFPWNEFLGPSYPFRVNNMTEAYAMVNAVAADYGAWYQKFREWEDTYWRSYVEGPKNVSASEVLIKMLTGIEDKYTELFKTAGGSYRAVAESLSSQGSELDLTAYFKDNKMLPFDQNLPDHYSLSIGRVPNPLVLKWLLRGLGWKDSATPGVLVR